MLVLTRKTSETIVIGDSIVIKVISCGHGKTKIGIEAPVTTRVLRGEILTSVQRTAPLTQPAAAAVLAH